MPTNFASSDFMDLSAGTTGLDRLTDVLWRNPTDNSYRRRTMSGSTLVSETVLPNLDGDNWQVAASGDQNRDGQTDFLWRNSQDGRLRWQIFDQANGLDLLTVSDFNWSIGGTADFDRDGALDVFWYNRASGETGWWLMRNGNEIREVVMLYQVGNPGEWNPVGTVDANSDGQIDILWNNTTSQKTGWWIMQGKNIQSVAYLVPPERDNNQQARGIGDFNRDGTIDILWQNRVTGAANLWLMDAVKGDEQVLRLENYGIDRPAGAALVGVSLGFAQIEGDVPGNLAAAQVQSSPIFFHHQTLDAGDLSDAYRFSVGSNGVFTAQMTGLTADADMELIEDRNRNGQVDSGEVLAFPWERGTKRESLRRFLTSGDYYLRVNSVAKTLSTYALATNFTPAAADPLGFSLQVSFGMGLEGLTAQAKQSVLAAAQYWENIILYRSDITLSNSLTIDLTGANLNLTNNNPDLVTFAFARPKVVFDGGKVKINSGASTINTRRLTELNGNPNYLKEVMIHEFAHVLGFGGLWQPVDYTDPNGVRSRVGNSFVDVATATYQANSYAGWVYGGLTGQGTAVAVPLDRESLTHWDEDLFDQEIMTPISEALGVAVPVSALTMAALRDLGWQVNMGAAQPYKLPRTPSAASNIDFSTLAVV
jgi:hypothetical protein